MMKQNILFSNNNYNVLDIYIKENRFKKILLVCGKSINLLEIGKYFRMLEERIGVGVVWFSDFEPNPSYNSVIKGIELFKKKACDTIFAVGGGSAIDVAKCIKLYATMDSGSNYLEQKIIPNDITLFAMPTTAGTGSESTRFAVIYCEGEKQSISDPSCIPGTVLLDASPLETLPLYQKKATMLDALCHAIESFWSINSTDESKSYSIKAIRLILDNKDLYLANNRSGNLNMLIAANLAGKAINITQTTAGHAMCYKLTRLYGIPHGHAAAVCIYRLWPYMIHNIHDCVDPRGETYLRNTFLQLAKAFGGSSLEDSVYIYQNFYRQLKLNGPTAKEKSDFDILKKSVNVTRLKNNPIKLDEKAIIDIYYQILGGENL